MIYQRWVGFCDKCSGEAPYGFSKASLIQSLRAAGWKIKRETRASGARVEHLTCPDCLKKEEEEQQRVVDEIAKMQSEWHPLTGGPRAPYGGRQ